MGTVFTFKEVIEEQKQPLDYKIGKAVEAMGEAFSLSKGAVGLAFSGGKDSTVLWHLARTHFPDREYHVIFGNTTVESRKALPLQGSLGRSGAAAGCISMKSFRKNWPGTA